MQKDVLAWICWPKILSPVLSFYSAHAHRCGLSEHFGFRQSAIKRATQKEIVSSFPN